MSFLLFQQNLPFQAVINYLRLYEPASTMPPDDWCREHVRDITVGDIVFVLDPIYSPWGDSSTGIGVADGDSFKVSQACFIYKREGGALVSLALTADVYEQHAIADLFVQHVQTARANAVGFYYVIVRSAENLHAERLRDLNQLDRFGNSGWRANDSGEVDIAVSFLTAAGIAVDPALNNQVVDVGQLAYMIFSDKEPPAGSRYPDLRKRFSAVGRNVHLAPVEPVGEVLTEELPALAGGMILPPSAGQQTEPAADMVPAVPPLVPPDAAFNATRRRIIPAKPQSITPVPTASSPLRSHAVPAAIPPASGEDYEQPGADESGFQSEASRPPDNQIHIPVAPPLPAGGPVAPPLPPSQAGPVPPPLPPRVPESKAQPSDAGVEAAGGSNVPAAEGQFQTRFQNRLGSIVPGLRQAPSGPVPPLPALRPDRAPQLEPVEPALSQAEPAGSLPDMDLELSQMAGPGSLPELTAAGEAVPEPVLAQQPAGEPEPPPAAARDYETSEFSGEAEPPPAEREIVSPPEIPAVVSLPPDLTLAGAKDSGIAGGDPAPEAGLNSLAAAPPIAGLPPRKKKPEVRDLSVAADVSSRAHLKEPVPVKSGVAGLVSKLEQQASKASSKLEAQVEEIQGRLSAELSQLLDKVGSSERRSVRSAEGLRKNLLSKMEAAAAEVKQDVRDASLSGTESVNEFVDSGRVAIDEKHEQLKVSLRQSFEAVRCRAEELARSFEESSNQQSEKSLADLKTLMDSLSAQFGEGGEFYVAALQDVFEHFKESILADEQYMADSLDGYYNNLEREIEDLHKRARKKIEYIAEEFQQKLARMTTASELDSTKALALAISDNVVPRLKEYRETLQIMISEFQQKLGLDLEERGSAKIAEIEPLLEEKKQEIATLLGDTTKIKEAIEERQRNQLEHIFDELTSFVEQSIEEANRIFKESEEQIGGIDRAVRVLADPSSIEGDLDLLSERDSVLERLTQCAEQATQEVHAALRTNVASLEEKGKALQEDLISSMEEDAYLVRRTSEQVLNRIRENIQDAFVAIQSAQDERME